MAFWMAAVLSVASSGRAPNRVTSNVFAHVPSAASARKERSLFFMHASVPKRRRNGKGMNVD